MVCPGFVEPHTRIAPGTRATAASRRVRKRARSNVEALGLEGLAGCAGNAVRLQIAWIALVLDSLDRCIRYIAVTAVIAFIDLGRNR
jgi:hypothetical protein